MTAFATEIVDAVTSAVLAVAVRLQDPVPASDEVRPGWIALALMVLLALATFLLWMNMRKQIRKIDFDEEPDAAESESDPADQPEPSPNGEPKA